MKKTAISLLLVLAMVASFVLVAAPVASAENTHNHSATTSHCACGGSLAGKHTCENLTDWKALKWVNTDPENVNAGTFSIGGSAVTFSSNKYTLTAGKHNFYLTEDTRLGPGFFVVPSGAEVTVCLNGYTLCGRETVSSVARLFDIQGGTVNIVDCGTGGAITGRAGSSSAQSSAAGGVFYIRGNNSTLNIFSGEVSYQASQCYAKGGLIYCPASKTGVSVNIYGGTLKGAKSNVEGDILYLGSGTLNLQGGTLEGGPNANALGSVYVAAAGSINFAGGKIVSGSNAGKAVVWGNDNLSLNITKMGLEIAENGSVGVGYITGYTMTDGMKAKLAASADLNNTAYGLKLWTEGGTPVFAGCNDKNATAVGAHLKNIMNINDTTVNDAANAVIPVKGVAYAVIGGTVVESVPQSFTLKNLIEKMDAKLTDDASLEVLKDLYKLYENVMSGWTLTKINAA